jgi:SAM-dependent methyltransferase
MSADHRDKVFAGNIPRLYEQYLVPLIFEPYGRDLAARVAAYKPARVLEVAAGTGVLTRAMDRALPAGCTIVATDLNGPMLEHARALGTARPVQWREADAMALPFGNGEFDAVACQFGAMFFPDRAAAFGEARRVLKPGGAFVFSVWDRIEDNELADVVTEAVAAMFRADPPRFLARTPHGYHQRAAILRDVASGGFGNPARIETVTERSIAPSARAVAIGYCQGTPLRNEIEARDASRLEEATDVATAAVAARFGSGPIDAQMQAHVVSVAA